MLSLRELKSIYCWGRLRHLLQDTCRKAFADVSAAVSTSATVFWSCFSKIYFSRYLRNFDSKETKHLFSNIICLRLALLLKVKIENDVANLRDLALVYSSLPR